MSFGVVTKGKQLGMINIEEEISGMMPSVNPQAGNLERFMFTHE